MSNNGPMITLGDSSKAPVLSYNIPEPSSYSGRNFIELPYREDYFKPEVKKKPEGTRTSIQEIKNIGTSGVKNVVLESVKTGMIDTKIFPNIRANTNEFRIISKTDPELTPRIIAKPGELVTTPIELPVPAKQITIDPEEVAANLVDGRRLNVYKNMYGTLSYNYIPEPTLRPRIMIVEKYQLSTFPGSYGAGKVIKTFSLLPGEKTKISINTYTKTESESKSASSILDSFNETSAKEFQDSLQTEESNKQNTNDSFEYHADIEAEASWGWGKAGISAGVKGGTNSAREDFAKNVGSTTEKHAAQASSKRDIQINTSYEVKQQSGEETSIERELQNINVSRTLNFVFRQMNQEYNTFLHLIDVKIAFFDGFAESRREVSLPNMNSLLEEVVVDGKREEVKNAIIEALTNIYDYNDEKQDNFVTDSLAGYKRVNKKFVSVYSDPATGTEHKVPGIIMSLTKSVLRTEGIIVEALLGQADALDEYSKGLQDEAIKEKALGNALLETEIEKNRLGMQIIADKDADAAKLFEQVFRKELCCENTGLKGDSDDN